MLAPLGVPAMRKDFIVDPYQVLEARAAGAGGVLVILRMLRRERIAALLETAADQGLFVLLEAFDAADLALAGELLSQRPARAAPMCWSESIAATWRPWRWCRADLPTWRRCSRGVPSPWPRAAWRRRTTPAPCGAWATGRPSSARP